MHCLPLVSTTCSIVPPCSTDTFSSAAYSLLRRTGVKLTGIVCGRHFVISKHGRARFASKSVLRMVEQYWYEYAPNFVNTNTIDCPTWGSLGTTFLFKTCHSHLRFGDACTHGKRNKQAVGYETIPCDRALESESGQPCVKANGLTNHSSTIDVLARQQASAEIYEEASRGILSIRATLIKTAQP